MSRLRITGAIFALAMGLSAGPALVAAEGFSFNDLRLTITRLPSSRPVHIDYAAPGGSASEDIAGAHPGVRVDLGPTLHLARIGGGCSLILAIAVFDAQQATAEDDNRTTAIVGPMKIGTQGMDIGLGLAAHLTGSYHLEVVPFAGAAFAKLTDRGIVGGNAATTRAESGSGSSIEYGVRAAVYYTGSRNHLQVGLGLGYQVTRTQGKLQFDLVNGGDLSETVTIRSRGLAPFVSFGYRF